MALWNETTIECLDCEKILAEITPEMTNLSPHNPLILTCPRCKDVYSISSWTDPTTEIIGLWSHKEHLVQFETKTEIKTDLFVKITKERKETCLKKFCDKIRSVGEELKTMSQRTRSKSKALQELRTGVEMLLKYYSDGIIENLTKEQSFQLADFLDPQNWHKVTGDYAAPLVIAEYDFLFDI